MHDLEGLRIKIQGEYQDAFLYGSHLLLLSDDLLEVIHFPHLLSRTLGSTPDEKVLYKYAFLKNDAFYDQGSLLYDFFGVDYIKSFLLKTYSKSKVTEIGRRDLARSCVAKIPHQHPGALHLEVYKHNLFISADRGTFAHKIFSSKELSKEHQIFDFPALHISANVGDLMYFSCGHNGLIVADFERNSRGQKETRPSSTRDYEEHAISTELAYHDFVCRTIDNTYTYRMNSLKKEGTHLSEYTPEAKVNAFTELNLRDASNTPVLKKASYVSTYNNRMVRLDSKQVTLFSMNYKHRMAAASAENENAHFFNQTSAIDIPNNYHFGEVFSGFQTVFGLVLDTEVGTIVLDDAPEGSVPLRMRTISRGENVKVRHYYRSRNYSHLVLNIKNSHLDVFSDLTNYFFPRRKKKLRVLKPFGSNNPGIFFNDLPFDDMPSDSMSS